MLRDTPSMSPVVLSSKPKLVPRNEFFTMYLCVCVCVCVYIYYIAHDISCHPIIVILYSSHSLCLHKGGSMIHTVSCEENLYVCVRVLSFSSLSAKDENS